MTLKTEFTPDGSEGEGRHAQAVRQRQAGRRGQAQARRLPPRAGAVRGRPRLDHAGRSGLQGQGRLSRSPARSKKSSSNLSERQAHRSRRVFAIACCKSIIRRGGQNSHLENGHPIRYSDRMSTYCAIAAPSRHPRGEPRSPSPANPPLTAAPIRSLPTGQPTHSRHPLTSASPFPPRSPFVVPGGVGDLGGLGDLDARPASPHDPARFVTTPGRLVVAPRVVPMDRRDQAASLQVHWHKQLRISVAKNEFRDTWPSATATRPALHRQLAVSQKPTPLQVANKLSWPPWPPWPTWPTRQNQPFYPAGPAAFGSEPRRAAPRNKLPRCRRRRQVPLGALAERFGSLSAKSDVELPRRRSDSPRQNPSAGTMMLAAPALPHSPADDPQVQARLELAVSAARAAGAVTLQWFRQSALAVERKGDGSPVTAADRAAESLLREQISAQFPRRRHPRRGIRREARHVPLPLGPRPDRRHEELHQRRPALHDAGRRDEGRPTARRRHLLPRHQRNRLRRRRRADLVRDRRRRAGRGARLAHRPTRRGDLRHHRTEHVRPPGKQVIRGVYNHLEKPAASPAPGATPTATCWSPPAAPT